MGRRAAAAKSFTAWAQRTGRLASDVGARLASPRPDKTLPSVLRVDQAAEMLLSRRRTRPWKPATRCGRGRAS